MLFDSTVRDRISVHLGFNVNTIPLDQLKKIVKDKPLNMINIIRGESNITFAKDVTPDTTSCKLARILNIILVDHFDSLEEFMTELKLYYPFIDDLWTSDIRDPKWTTIRDMITIWNIDPIYLYGTNQNQSVEPYKEMAA